MYLSCNPIYRVTSTRRVPRVSRASTDNGDRLQRENLFGLPLRATCGQMVAAEREPRIRSNPIIIPAIFYPTAPNLMFYLGGQSHK
jgi:hypothetical protein